MSYSDIWQKAVKQLDPRQLDPWQEFTCTGQLFRVGFQQRLEEIVTLFLRFNDQNSPWGRGYEAPTSPIPEQTASALFQHREDMDKTAYIHILAFALWVERRCDRNEADNTLLDEIIHTCVKEVGHPWTSSGRVSKYFPEDNDYILFRHMGLKLNTVEQVIYAAVLNFSIVLNTWSLIAVHQDEDAISEAHEEFIQKMDIFGSTPR